MKRPITIFTCLVLIQVTLVQPSELSLDSAILSRGTLLNKRSTSDTVLCDCAEYVFYKDPVNWPTANSTCVSSGGRLAEIYDKETDDLILATITDTNNDLSEGLTGYWIGLNDIATEDTFVWPSGEVLQTCSYQNWAPREPNNNTKKNPDGQDCVQLWKGRGFRWDDAYCNKNKGYICMYQAADCPSACTACAA